jgi:hypothetical protein
MYWKKRDFWRGFFWYVIAFALAPRWLANTIELWHPITLRASVQLQSEVTINLRSVGFFISIYVLLHLSLYVSRFFCSYLSIFLYYRYTIFLGKCTALTIVCQSALFFYYSDICCTSLFFCSLSSLICLHIVYEKQQHLVNKLF